jgi:UDP-3-O-[3-hydroxymyristoyl] N-acetylglucosamine deacetylase / 3-hydroxyacyl-[acyl-carrier-protein] dehydratase
MLTTRRPQRTIAREAVVRGVSFLEGRDVELRFRPAEADTGVVFVRSDLPEAPSVPAHVKYVVPRQRRTTLQRGAATVEMVEHVMAALSGLEVDNCRIEINGPETPGCDGSSLAFVEAIQAAGVVEQDRPKGLLVIDRPVTVREGSSVLSAHPGDADKLVLTYNLDYGRQTPIGAQSLFVEVSPESFRTELASSRTFLLEAEAEALRKAGIGRRTTEADLLIFGPEGPIGNKLRYKDECVRHKILDLVGDLALLDRDLAGHVVAHRSGHALNASLVRKLLHAVEDAPRTHSLKASAPVMDIADIQAILPHRYPFLLVDRVIELDPGRRIKAYKNITCNEPFFGGHWPGRPIMPGVLILEALAQTAGLLIARHHAGYVDHFMMIVSIDGVKLRRPVVPGDQLMLEVTAARIKDRSADVVCRATVEGKIAAEAKIRFMIMNNVAASA